jgi:hypothetical protein
VWSELGRRAANRVSPQLVAAAALFCHQLRSAVTLWLTRQSHHMGSSGCHGCSRRRRAHSARLDEAPGRSFAPRPCRPGVLFDRKDVCAWFRAEATRSPQAIPSTVLDVKGDQWEFAHTWRRDASSLAGLVSETQTIGRYFARNESAVPPTAAGVEHPGRCEL